MKKGLQKERKGSYQNNPFLHFFITKIVNRKLFCKKECFFLIFYFLMSKKDYIFSHQSQKVPCLSRFLEIFFATFFLVVFCRKIIFR